ncbi:hypothetical protein [Methylopila turkensis]|nr:hypothetical protein [Methylopila turkensis]
MAKAQKRGNKEAKKPKKIREAQPAPTTALKIGAAPPSGPKSKKI